MLGHLRDDVVPAIPVEFANAFDSQVVRLGRPAREHNLLGGRPDQSTDLFPGKFHGGIGLPAEPVSTGCRIAEPFGKKGKDRV